MTRRSNITAEQKDLIATKREAGWSTARIAKKIGMSRGAVSWICLQLGADPPNAKPLPQTSRGKSVIMRGGKVVRRFTPEEDAQLIAMSLDGMGPFQIAGVLKRRHNSVIGRLMTLARHDARNERAIERNISHATTSPQAAQHLRP